MKRHALIPKHLSAAEVPEWIKLNAVSQFPDTQKRYFTPEEVSDFEHESSVNGRETNRLNDVIKYVSDLCKKGNLDEPVVITIPVTLGTKVLEVQRRQNDDMIEAGYEVDEVVVFAIPYGDEETMEFFTADGSHFPERSRPMTMKEKHEHIGTLLMASNAKRVTDGAGQIADEDTGEYLGDEAANG